MQPRPEFAQTQPPPQEDQEAGMGTIVLLGVVGLFGGLAVIGLIVAGARWATAPDPIAPEPAPALIERVFEKKPVKQPTIEEPAKTILEPAKEPVVEKPVEKTEPKTEPKTPVKKEATVKPPPADLIPPPPDLGGFEAVPDPNATVSVRVVSIPAGAEVRLNGMVQRTPGTLDVLTGVSSAYITFPDGKTGSCTIIIDKGTTQLAFRQANGKVTCP